MSQLLSIHVSTRGDESFSNRLLAQFEKQFLSEHPELQLKSRFTGEIPHLDFEAQLAGRIPVEKQDSIQSKAFSLANELTEELLEASALVIATPMYNWGPPSSLKAWFDRIINTRTFYQNSGILSGLPATVIISSGGLYSEGENAKHDFLRPWLLECFGRLGMQDVMFIDCDPAGPMEYGRVDPEASDSGFSKALRQIPAAVLRAK
jgi:FMN-dependent NADH-azoreductase